MEVSCSKLGVSRLYFWEVNIENNIIIKIIVSSTKKLNNFHSELFLWYTMIYHYH